MSKLPGPYFVYHNWTVEAGGRATVHRAHCSFCNNGQGIHGDYSGAGCWIGSFKRLSTARKEAKLTGARNHRDCSFCMQQNMPKWQKQKGQNI